MRQQPHKTGVVMGHFIPNTGADRSVMLKAIGRNSVEELFDAAPKSVLLKDINLPSEMSEMEAERTMRSLASRNTVYPVIFRGAGAYKHYIPAAVKRISSAETFVTAYTPYQAEISQGILQSIFEYQTMICEITGMDVSNASVYDGASAAAEAANMCRDRARQTIYVSETAHPQIIQTIKTYCFGSGAAVKIVPPQKDGTTDLAKLKEIVFADKTAACFYLQNPNFYGLVEDARQAAAIAHEGGSLLVEGVNPTSLGIMESPGMCGADIAVGEGQPLGLPLAFGGPYLGFMACKKAFMRKMPGRIVGETTDAQGKRAYVLTLQAREQHIRREKASSNVCSNEAHCALTAACYMAVLGKEGFAEVSAQCHSKAAYTAKAIASVKGYELVYPGEFFHEFVTACPDADATLAALEQHGILGGYPLSKTRLLWCVTELNTKAEIDALVSILKNGGSHEVAI
jgi:glycine dehydrogenase subunit 1